MAYSSVSRRNALVGAAILAATALTGCSANNSHHHSTPASPSSSESFNVHELGAQVDTSKKIPVVTKGFATAPFLHLPKSSDSSRPYGVVTAANGSGKFVTATGEYPIDQQAITAITPASSMEGNSTALEQGYVNTIYRASLHGGKVKKLFPVARVTTSAIMTSLLAGRSLEGLIDTRNGDGYAMTPSLPVRIDLEDKISNQNGILGIEGKIANATNSVRLKNGKTAPSLTSAKSRNPLNGDFTAKIHIERFPSMHSAFDDELVLAWSASSSGMGSELFPTLAHMAGLKKFEGNWNIVQHAAPSSGPELTLHLA